MKTAEWLAECCSGTAFRAVVFHCFLLICKQPWMLPMSKLGAFFEVQGEEVGFRWMAVAMAMT